ncbi:MAG: helix-turn-helix domain-containing protein [Nanoarchaeota archaeon]
MGEKYINFNLDDPRADKLAEALSNKTCKKILSLLVEKDMNASEIAQALNLPLNTIGYNLEKLVSAGLIEKSKKFFWSVKGKKIDSYAIVNKKIIISPKNMIKGVVPSIIISALIATGIGIFENMHVTSIKAGAELMKGASDKAPAFYSGAERIAPVAPETAVNALQNISNSTNYIWAWFLLGAFIALLVFLIWNWKKK